MILTEANRGDCHGISDLSKLPKAHNETLLSESKRAKSDLMRRRPKMIESKSRRHKRKLSLLFVRNNVSELYHCVSGPWSA